MNLFDVLFAKKLSGGGSPFPPVIKRVTGNPIEFTDGADAPLVKCVTEIQGSQDLHGQDKPWVGGAGKNKCNGNALQGYWAGSDGSFVSSNTYISTDKMECKSNTYYTISADATYKVGNQGVCWYDSNGDYISFNEHRTSAGAYVNWTFQSPENAKYMAYDLQKNPNESTISPSDITHIQVEEGQTATTFEPYSNICPITAYTEGEIEVSDGDGNTTTHNTTYPSAIYRGSEDVVNGEVTSDMPVIDLGDLSWSAYTTDTTGHSFYVNVPNGTKSVSSDSSVANMVCENYETVAFINPSEWLRRDAIICQVPNTQRWIVRDERYSDATAFTTAMNGVQLAYELEIPITSPVTPTNLPIKSLSGYNHIESTTGEMTIDYITDAYQNFVDTVESALPNTTRNLLSASKGGVKAFDIFKTLDEPKKPEASAEESEPEEKEAEEGAKK